VNYADEQMPTDVSMWWLNIILWTFQECWQFSIHYYYMQRIQY